MEIMSKRSRISNEEDVLPVELIHCIQSLLPLKEGARTCILSKSWLHAWYTLPNLSLIPPEEPNKCFSTHENETKYYKLIHSTLQRYHRDNTPIQSFHLQLKIVKNNFNLEEVENWIRLAASKSSLRELSLDFMVFLDDDQSLALPNELFSSPGLHKIHVTAGFTYNDLTNFPLRIRPTNVINCVSLRVLDLECVFVNQDTFHNLLSTCKLLEKIKLSSCVGLKNVKVKNLLRLTKLEILSIEQDDLWEINNVPSLCSFHYRHQIDSRKPIPFQMDSLASVTHLCIEGCLIFDNSFFDTLESKFPVLESLTLVIERCELKNWGFTSASLKWLNLDLFGSGPVNVQVNAPRLISFIYTGKLPALLFRTTAPKQVKLTLSSWENLGYSYFLKMREALNSSSKFDIYIGHKVLSRLVPMYIDVVDLRRRVLFPVGNVELKLRTCLDEHAWEQSRFFDAFFLVCHPSYINSSYEVIRKMMEANTTDLKEVLLKNPHNEKWEALTSSWISVLHEYPDHLFECKLNWFHQ